MDERADRAVHQRTPYQRLTRFPRLYSQHTPTVRSLQVIDKSKKEPPLPATDWGPRPGDFPLGSVESRAVARMQLQQGDHRKRIELISHIPGPWRGEGPEPEGWNKEPRIGPWKDCGDRLMRFVYVPIE